MNLMNTSKEVSLGDRIYLKETGEIGVGTVIAIIASSRYNNLTYGDNYKLWDSLYPGWREKPIVWVEWDKPQRNCSFEEYCKQHEDSQRFAELSQEDKQYFYKLNVPETWFVATPIEDSNVI